MAPLPQVLTQKLVVEVGWSCKREWKQETLVWDCITVAKVVGSVHVQLFSHIWLFTTLWTIGHQAPLSIGVPRQEYWSGLPFPSPGDLPNPGIKPISPVSPDLAGRFLPLRSAIRECLKLQSVSSLKRDSRGFWLWVGWSPSGSGNTLDQNFPCQPTHDSLCQWLNPESEKAAHIKDVQPGPATKHSTRQEDPTPRRQPSPPDDQTHMQSN